MFSRTRLALLLSSVILLAALPVPAATVVYADLTSWQNATLSSTDISFSGLASPGSFKEYSTSIGLLVSGVRFVGYLSSDQSYSLQVLDQNSQSPWFNWGSPATLFIDYNSYDPTHLGAYIPYIRVTLPANTTAFSTNLATGNPNGLSFQVASSDGSSYTAVTPGVRPNLGFVGVTSDVPISYVDFTVLGSTYHGGTYGLLANFKTGVTGVTPAPVDPGQVPEAGTLLLIGGGLAFISAKFKNRFLRTMLPA